jgi:hypothetical protein
MLHVSFYQILKMMYFATSGFPDVAGHVPPEMVHAVRDLIESSHLVH